MGYDTAAKTDADSVVPEEWGGMWFLRDELDTDHLGLSVLELEPGGKGKEHDEADSGQEEVYYVVDGQIEIELAEETVALSTDEAIRLDPGERRQIHNRGDDRCRLMPTGALL